MTEARFVIRKSKDGQFYFIYRASNGEVLFSSETYTSKQSATVGINAIKKDIVAAGTIDMTD